MSNLKLVKPTTEAEKTTKTTSDTIEFTPDIARSWQLPPFQRPLQVTARVLEIAKEIAANDGVLPGVITLGVLDGVRYLVDGQHRREAFFHSECLTGYCDIRTLYFKTMAEMAAEFYRLNSRIVNMRPDDYLRALESESAALAKLRKRCPFIGYDMVRRNERSPVLSMSSVLRCWNSSSKEVPQSGGAATTEIARALNSDDADHLITFITRAMTAWGRDREYVRLWGNLNLTLCMWLYRRLVLVQYSAKSPRMSDDLFQKCMSALSADDSYLTYLQGRQLTNVHRSPTYAKIKAVFARRIEEETGKKTSLPQPAWAHGGGRK
jgi:hypothetical protein